MTKIIRTKFETHKLRWLRAYGHMLLSMRTYATNHVGTQYKTFRAYDVKHEDLCFQA